MDVWQGERSREGTDSLEKCDVGGNRVVVVLFFPNHRRRVARIKPRRPRTTRTPDDIREKNSKGRIPSAST